MNKSLLIFLFVITLCETQAQVLHEDYDQYHFVQDSLYTVGRINKTDDTDTIVEFNIQYPYNYKKFIQKTNEKTYDFHVKQVYLKLDIMDDFIEDSLIFNSEIQLKVTGMIIRFEHNENVWNQRLDIDDIVQFKSEYENDKCYSEIMKYVNYAIEAKPSIRFTEKYYLVTRKSYEPWWLPFKKVVSFGPPIIGF